MNCAGPLKRSVPVLVGITDQAVIGQLLQRATGKIQLFPDTHDVDHALQIAQALFVETINLCRQERLVSTCEHKPWFFGDSPLKVSESITKSSSS